MSTRNAPHRTYSFGDFTLDVDRGALLSAGADVKIRPKSFEVLFYLVERQGRLVTKNELLDSVWSPAVVTEDAVTQCLIDIRKVMGDGSHEMIRTIPRRGYIFELPVSEHGGPDAASDTKIPVSSAGGWSRWRLAAALGLLLAGIAIWWGFGKVGINVPLTVEPQSAIGYPSIAVLPFADMSPEQDQEYFADGISEEILNLLSQIPELRVIARTSSFSFKNQNVDIAEIAKALNITHVLEGSVRRSDNIIRVTAQLVDASTSEHVWSETYDRSFDDIFQIQDEISASVVARLEISLLRDAPTTAKTDPEVLALTLKARHVRGTGTPEGWEQAIVLYQQALAIDPDYADAWYGLGDTYRTQMWQGFLRPMEGQPLARNAFNKVLAINPHDARALAELSIIALDYDYDTAAAARYLERAFEQQPSTPIVLAPAAIMLQSLGRQDEDIALWEYILLIDPVSIGNRGNLTTSYYMAGRFDEALASNQIERSHHSGRFIGDFTAGMSLLQMGDPEAALAEIQQVRRSGWRMIGLPMAYHALGRAAESDAALAELIEKHEQGFAYDIAYVLAFRGEADRAFEWLDKAVRYRDPGLARVFMEPAFDNIHDDPRWRPFLESIGKSPEQLAAIEFNLALPE